MGKQVHFYMEQEIFTQLAQTAIDLGCLILKQKGSKITSSADTSIITKDCSQYYFYLPETGRLDENLPLGCYNSNGNLVIESGYTTCADNSTLLRTRLYIINGFTDKNGDFIERPECLAAVYNKLVARMKQLTKYVEIPAEKFSMRRNYYADPTNRSHKIYITDKLNRRLQKSGCILG